MSVKVAMAQGGMSRGYIDEFVRRLADVNAKLEVHHIAVAQYCERVARLAQAWTDREASCEKGGQGVATPDILDGHGESSVRSALE